MDILLFLDHWQTLVGSIIGASMPFLFWWVIEQYRKRKKKKEYLYYLERIVVDQINLLIELRDTVQKFLNLRLNTILESINNTPDLTYMSVDAFFPLFSVRSLPDDVNAISSGSGYIDNKVAKIYALSKDFPHIIDDTRLQFRETLETNKKIISERLTEPKAQKEQLKKHIQEYKKTVKEELLRKNIPSYFKKLAETLIAIRSKASMSSIAWKIKFDPRWKFYVKKKIYLKEREQIGDIMDTYFEPAREKFIKENIKN